MTRNSLPQMAIALCAALSLAACGGGGGSAPPGQSPPVETGNGAAPDPPPVLPPARPGFPPSPVMHLPDGRTVVGRAPDDIVHRRASPLPAAGSHRGFTLSSGRVRDGAGADEVVAYLREVVADFSGEVAAFPGNPVVRVNTDNTDLQYGLVERAVAILNSALPYDRRLLMGEDIPPLDRLEDVPDGQIYVEFGSVDRFEDYLSQTESETIGIGGSSVNPDGTIRAGFAVVDEDYDGPVNRTFILLHELTHALGFGHVSEANFPTSILNPEATERDRHQNDFAVIDRAALLAATRFSPGTEPGDITRDSLGPWNAASFHLRAGLAFPGGSLAFGVTSYNGLGYSWAAGDTPATHLEDNRALSGSATWNGALLGLTPAEDAVAGEARISVNLARLDGRADFMELETWTARIPGSPGSGTIWGDGDLGYTIAIDGNSFFETGGDDGTLSGAFVGASHEGTAGTLERRDLSAAFGATR